MSTVKLTKTIVENLKADPSKPVTIFRDSQVTGLQVRAYPSGRKTFTLDYRTRGGTNKTFTLGTFPTLTIHQARAKAGEARRDVMLGGDPAKSRSAQKSAPTVAQLCDRYIAEHVDVHNAKSTAKEVRRIVATRIKPKLGQVKVSDLAREDVRKWHLSMKSIPSEGNRALAYLRKALSLAVREWSLRPDNPAQAMKLFKETKRQRFLSESEHGHLGKAMAQAEKKGSEHPSALAALRLLMFTGCRLSEIMTLCWEHVDWDHRRLLLPTSKTGPKAVHLSAPALQILQTIKAQPNNSYVIYGTVQGERFKGIHKAWVRIRDAAKLDGVRIHDLRHNFASVGAGGGLSLPIIGRLLGHTQAATTLRYAHLADDPVRTAAERIGAAINAQMQAESAEIVPLRSARSRT